MPTGLFQNFGWNFQTSVPQPEEFIPLQQGWSVDFLRGHQP